MTLRGRAAGALTAFALAAFGALGGAGCAEGGSVVRVYDGRAVHGAYVPADAYAAYLRGVLAAESGEHDLAIASFAHAVQLDEEDPELWARLGEARCEADPRDPRVDAAFRQALALDGASASALAAESRCALRRGDDAQAAALAARAASADPASASIGALLVKAEARRPDARARDAAVALTLLHRERAVAWDALARWARAHHDPELLTRGLLGELAADPSRTEDVEAGARELLGDGHVALAQGVAAAIADAPRERLVRGPRDEVLARLAVDEALARGDEDAARHRATRGHVELVEAAARALVLERRELATSLASSVAEADPGASGARMVLAAAAADPGAARVLASATATTDRPPALCALVLAERIARVAGAEVAARWLSEVERRPIAPHDPLSARLAVELAARGVVAPSELPAGARIELAARRGEAPAPLASGEAADAVDARHELLWRALVDPKGQGTRRLVARLGTGSSHDPLVAFAIARVALAEGALEEGTLALLREAVKAAPSDALVLAASLVVGKRAGRGDDLGPVRARLMAVARTPAERALAAE